MQDGAAILAELTCFRILSFSNTAFLGTEFRSPDVCSKYAKHVLNDIARVIFGCTADTKLQVVSLGKKGIQDGSSDFLEGYSNVNQKTYLRSMSVDARGCQHAHAIGIPREEAGRVEPKSDMLKIDVANEHMTFLRYGEN